MAVNYEEQQECSSTEKRAACLPLPKASWGYDESVEADVPSYDPEGAKKLLEEAGYGDGFTLNMYVTNENFRQKAATILQSYWKMIGVDLEINTVEWGTFSETGASGKADVFAMGWSGIRIPTFSWIRCLPLLPSELLETDRDTAMRS